MRSARGLTCDAQAIWKFLRGQPGQWLTAEQITHYWRPTFALQEVQDCLAALCACRAIARQSLRRGDAFAVTGECKALPGH